MFFSLPSFFHAQPWRRCVGLYASVLVYVVLHFYLFYLFFLFVSMSVHAWRGGGCVPSCMQYGNSCIKLHTGFV